MAKDIDLLAKNAKTYNEPGSQVFKVSFVVVAFIDKNTDFNLEPIFLCKNHIPFILPKVCNLMTFSIFTELCSHHHNELTIALPFLPVSLIASLLSISVHLPVFNISYKWNLTICSLFCDWLLSLSIMFSGCSFCIIYFFLFPNSIQLNLYIMF